MPWEFTEHHVRPNVFYWSPTAYEERNEVKTRRDEAQKAYREAKKATADGRHADAERLLLHSVAAWPDNDRFSLALANCLFLDGGRPGEALEWYNEIVRLKDCSVYRAARSRVRAALGQLVLALEDIEAATREEPKNPGFVISRAMLKERLGRFQDAIVDYTAALPLCKAEGLPIFECLFNRGYCYKMLGQIDMAIADMEAAMLQSTASMTVRTVLGVMYLTRRRYSRALDLFSVVAQHQSASASAANNVALAAYLAATSDYDDSSTATRAASLNQQRRRAALMATSSMRRRQSAQEGEGSSAPSSKAPSPLPDAHRSLASQVAQVRKAAAAAAGERATSASRRVPPLAVLLDERVAADEGPLTLPKHLRRHPDASNQRRRFQSSSSSATTMNPDGGSGGGSGPYNGFDGGTSSSEDELYGSTTGEGGEPPPTVYLPSNPRQWAVDIVRDSDLQTVWEPDKKALLDQSLRNYDRALDNQKRLLEERSRTVGGKWPLRQGRDELDSDTTALDVGEAGDVPGGLLLVLDGESRLPGTAVVHDREIEYGEVQYNRGLVLLALGRLNEASADLDSAQAANPHHAHYPYYQAVVCARRGRDEEAIVWDKEALHRNPRYFHALYHLGLVLHLRGEHSEAIQRLDKAAVLQPRNWQVMEARGRVLQDLDRHADAVPALKAALDLVRSDGDQPHAVSARLYFALAQSAVAAHLPNLLKESLRLARLNGQDPASVYNLRGCLARKERQFAAALRHLTRAVQRSSRDPRFYYDRAQCYMDMGRWPEAIDDLTWALEVMPLHSVSPPPPVAPTATAPTSRRNSAGSSSPATATVASPSARDAPSHSHSLSYSYSRSNTNTVNSAATSGGYGDGGGGEGAAGGGGGGGSPGASSSPQMGLPLLLFSRGGAQLAFEAGDVRAAAADLRRAVQLCEGVLRGEGPLWESRKFMSSGSGAPDLSPSLWYQLGCAHARCGHPEEAVAAFQRAVALMPNHPTFLHELAKACQVSGDHESAVVHFNRVLQLQPRNSRALLRRGLALKCLRRYEEAAEDLLAARRLDPGNPLMMLDMRALGSVDFLELCSPGEEDDVFVVTKY